MPAIQSYFIEPIWEQFRALLPAREVNHPLGCHRPRIPDRIVFEKSVQVLVFGCAYWRIADEECSDTTLRRRRDEWIDLGVTEVLREMVLEVYDRTIGLEVGEMALDCCITKAPCGGEKAGRRTRWIEENKAPNARRLWTREASLWVPLQPPPTATTRRC